MKAWYAWGMLQMCGRAVAGPTMCWLGGLCHAVGGNSILQAHLHTYKAGLGNSMGVGKTEANNKK